MSIFIDIARVPAAVNSLGNRGILSSCRLLSLKKFN